jgi:hypothetical protein
MNYVVNLEEFIRQNAPYLTLSDIVHETGLALHIVRKKCIDLAITPIRGDDQTRQYIHDHYTYKSPHEIAKLLGCSEENLRRFYRQLDIPFSKWDPHEASIYKKAPRKTRQGTKKDWYKKRTHAVAKPNNPGKHL